MNALAFSPERPDCARTTQHTLGNSVPSSAGARGLDMALTKAPTRNVRGPNTLMKTLDGAPLSQTLGRTVLSSAKNEITPL